MPRREALAVGLAAVLLVVVLPVCNALPAGSPLALSNFTLNLFGKFLTYAILALGLDLLWGYAGVLSLGHGVFFGLGAYAMGMHLMLEIGAKSVYQSSLPDFMVWNQVTALPLFWKPFQSSVFTLAAVVLVPALFGLAFGYLAFRSRIRGVYFSIITQALALSAWLVFNRNEMNLGGTNGLADFKTIFGFPLNRPGTQRALYVVTALGLVAAYLVCRWITLTRAGKVLVAIRDSETRVLFSGYSPAAYKLFVFVVSAVALGCLATVVASGTDQIGMRLGPGLTGVLQGALGRRIQNAGVVDRIGRGHPSEQIFPIQNRSQLGIHRDARFVEVAHLGAERRRERARVDSLDVVNARSSCDKTLPHLGNRRPNRRDGADAGDDYPPSTFDV